MRNKIRWIETKCINIQFITKACFHWPHGTSVYTPRGPNKSVHRVRKRLRDLLPSIFPCITKRAHNKIRGKLKIYSNDSIRLLFKKRFIITLGLVGAVYPLKMNITKTSYICVYSEIERRIKLRLLTVLFTRTCK